MEFLENLQQNDWWKYVTLAVTIASAIAATTPTPKAGSLWAKVYKGIDWLALNIGKAKDKGTPEPEVKADAPTPAANEQK